MIYKLNFKRPYKDYPNPVFHTTFFGQNEVLVPKKISDLISPVSMYLNRSLTPTETKFINSYDPRLETIYTEANKLREKISNLRTKVQELSPEKPIRVVTVNNDTIPVSTYNASILDKKAILGNPNGSMFIADFGNMS
jgi:hypothetical protein